MLTRCPSCVTTFRITPEQLKAKQGRVRCGRCQTVFNAIETLADVPVTDAARDLAVSPAPTFAAPGREATPNQSETAVAPETDAASAQIEPPMGAERLADHDPTFGQLMEEPARRAWPWAIGLLLALTALGLQAAHQFRTELAVLLPEAKPALEQMCTAFGCDLPLPGKIGLVSIETSDLHPDPQKIAGRLQMIATLRNRAPFVQQYPHLELTLTDAADKVQLRRVLPPADYLPKDKVAAKGFAANSDLSVSIAFDVREIAPIGYRLYVFYP
jgi:predicted Zn finger-like uncharacterized protein